MTHPTLLIPPPSIDQLLDRADLELPVIQRLPVPGYPHKSSAQQPTDQIDAFRRTWGENFLGELTLPDGSRFAYCNKTNPHALYDNMLIQTDDEVRGTIAALSGEQVTFALRRAADFIDFVSAPDTVRPFGLDGGHAHLVYNTDPLTQDRESGMGYSKRFHLHLNYWPERALADAPITRLGSVRSLRQRRRLLDPLTPLAGRMLAELSGRHGLFAGHTVETGRPSTAAAPRPPGFNVQLSGGWDTLRDPAFQADLRTLHREADDLFEQVRAIFTGQRGPSPAWTRPQLRPRADILADLEHLGFSDHVQAGLALLAAVLHDVSPRLTGRMRTHASTRITHLSMNGLCYSTGFYAPQRNTLRQPLRTAAQVHMVIQAKLLADVGGAGMIYTGDAGIVELARGARSFTDREQADRTAFQQGFIAWP